LLDHTILDLYSPVVAVPDLLLSGRMVRIAEVVFMDHKPTLTNDIRRNSDCRQYQLLEKLAYQSRERIPERAVHANGWGVARYLFFSVVVLQQRNRFLKRQVDTDGIVIGETGG
jgi:hypothetical protein